MSKYRKGVFVVVYAMQDKEPKYLLLRRKLHWIGWEFPKGGVNEKESFVEAVRREVKEETGLNFITLNKFNFSGKYDYPKEFADRKKISGQTIEGLYAVEIKSSQMEKIVVDEKEHSEFKWVDYQTAQKLLTWENQQQALRIVHEYLIGKDYTGFRKSMTASGKLFLAGKTEANNEQLVKTQIKPEEIVFHTVARGSPFVVIKSKDKPTKEDLKEAAIFCAKHSKDWRDNKKDVVVHYFKGEDIYKTATMKVGTFGVKNVREIKVKKEWISK